MDDHLGVQVVEREYDGGDHKLGLSFSEDGHLGEMVPQVSALHDVHEDVEVVLVLEGVHHVDNKLMPQRGEELALVEDRIDAALCDDSKIPYLLHRLRHLLHRVDLARRQVLHLPHLPEPALPHHVHVLVRLLAQVKVLKAQLFLLLLPSLDLRLLQTVPILVSLLRAVLLQRLEFLRGDFVGHSLEVLRRRMGRTENGMVTHRGAELL